MDFSPLFLNSLFNTYSSNMAGIIGSMSSFDATEETWSSYIERFEIFVEANDIKTEKKVCTLLAVIGVKMYNLLQNLCSPDKPNSKTYNDIIKIVETHLCPKPSFIAERYKFSLRKQQINETVAEYIVQLKHLSIHCDFKDQLPDYLRDRLVSGILSDAIKKRLLAETDLTYEKAVNIATTMEAADKDSLTLASSSTGITQGLQQMRRQTTVAQGHSSQSKQHRQPRRNQPEWSHNATSNLKREERSQSAVLCYCCGKIGHMTNVCKFRNYKCYFCNKIGHLEANCKSKAKGKSANNCNRNMSFQNKKFYNNKQHFVDSTEASLDLKSNSVNGNNEETYDIANLFQVEPVKTKLRVKPITLELKVENKKVVFEVDSGACVSVISDKYYEQHFKNVELKHTELVLSSYTNHPIKPYGQLSVKVEYENQIKDLDLYVIKNGANPLIGRDWIQELQLVINIPNDRLNKTEVQNVQTNENIVCNLVKEFPEVFTNELGTYTGEPVKLNLKSDAKPKYFKPRPIPFALKQKVEQELDRLVESGILTPVKTSEWGTPIVPVLKSDGKLRICGDFKVSLNPFLEVDRYPIPKIEDLLASLQKGETFSKIDLSQAYAQIKLDEKSKEYCTISTSKGLFRYNRMPYGISSGPGIFERITEQVLHDIPGTVVFLDDVLITAENQSEHVNRLREVCKRLSKNGLTVRKDKCKFFCKQIEYLGFVLSKEGLSTSKNKVEAILKAPTPTNVTQLKSFLGLVNYYSKFVPNLSTMAMPMYKLLQKDVPFEWSLACKKSFEQIKEKLVVAPILAHYDPELPLRLTTDSSSYGIGYVLSQIEIDGSEKPICFGSRSLSKTEQAYSVIEKESLAIIEGVKKFNQYLFGRKFCLLTDHKPLLSIFGPKKGLPAYAAGRLQRYAVFLSAYDFDIQYIRSKSNLTADFLSRLPLNSKEAVQLNKDSDETDICFVGTYLQCLKDNDIPVDFNNVQIETQKDAELSTILKYVRLGWPNFDVNNELKPYFQRQSEITVEQNILMWGHRVIIPKKLRKQMLDELHGGHMGIVKMKSIARSYIWWPGIDRDIELLSNSCSLCLMERSNPPRCNLHVWEYSSKPFQRIHVDFLGPLNGKLYLIVIDSYTKWLEVEIVSSTAAVQTIDKLRTIFARFGLPEQIVSDNGPPFSSFEFSQFIKSNGIRHTLTPSYHPASNGQAENSVRTVKKRLRLALSEKQNVLLALNRFLLAYRNAVHSTTNETPAKLMFNRYLRTRLDLIRPNIAYNVHMKQEKQMTNYGGSKTRSLYVGQLVLVRDYRGKDKWIEGVVSKILSSVSYLVKLCNGIVWKRHIDQIITLQNEQSSGSADIASSIKPYDLSLPTHIPQSNVCDLKGQRSHLRSADSSYSQDNYVSPSRHSHTPSLNSPSPNRPNSMMSSPADRNCQNVNNDRRYPIRERKPVQKLNL